MAKRSFARAGVKGKKSTIAVVVLLLALATILMVTGLNIPSFADIKGAGDIRYGIDIRGGVSAVFAPKDLQGAPTESQIASAKQIIEFRMDSLQILDREVTSSTKNGQIIVRFPWRSDEKVFNPEKALQELGAMAKLTFKDPDGKIVLDGSDVKNATAATDTQKNEPIVQLQLTDAGTKKFADATGRLYLLNQQGDSSKATISINMDDKQISAPVVQAHITDGKAVISSTKFTVKEAIDLAQKIQAGALPFAMTAISSSTISPSLGQGSLELMVRAGVIAFIVISIFMLLAYRLLGLVGILSLTAQVVGIILAISIPQQTLTLQGIAGIILSIGMGVDANIILSSRIREEINKGGTLNTALSNGIERAFSSVWDGNITVAIAAAVLMIFGSGTMLSFGYSLLVGVILNGITGVWMTRLMIGSLSAYPKLQSPWLYGRKKERVA